MKIVVISDTHEQHGLLTIPDGDMLIHCGDFTNRGQLDRVESFFNWFSNQPHQFKLACAGNHELLSDYNHPRRQEFLDLVRLFTDKDKNLHYLENSGVEIEGIKFFGSPASPFFYSWSHNYQRGEQIAKVWENIPDNVNILITHCGPFGILDKTTDGQFVGCEDLSNRIRDLKNLKAHLSGHIHNSYGMKIINNVIYVNASSCNERYEPINPPIVIEI